MWELAQLFNRLFGLTYPPGRKRHYLCLQSKCSTFLSPVLHPEKGCLHSYCRCGKELNPENVEGDALRCKGLKNNGRMTQGSCPALTATCPSFLCPAVAHPRSPSESISHQNNSKRQAAGSCPFSTTTLKSNRPLTVYLRHPFLLCSLAVTIHTAVICCSPQSKWI